MATDAEAIIQAVRPLFVRYGFKKTSIDEIARAARVSKATLYSRFGDKEGLFAAVVRAEAESLMRANREAVDAAEGYSAKLRALLETHFERMTEIGDLAKMSSEVLGELLPLAVKVTEEFGREHLELLARLLRDGAAAGELLVPRPDAVAFTIQTAIRYLVHEHLLEEDRSRFREGLHDLLEIFMRGVTRPRSDRDTEVNE